MAIYIYIINNINIFCFGIRNIYIYIIYYIYMVIRKLKQQVQLPLAGPQAQLRSLPVGEASQLARRRS